MRLPLFFFAVFIALTLVSRAAFPMTQFYTSGADTHAHNDLSSERVFVGGLLEHAHEHEHEEKGSDHDSSSEPSEPSSHSGGHNHSHTHVLVESPAYISNDSTLKSSLVIQQKVSRSTPEETYFFNFLSRIFRPPIS